MKISGQDRFVAEINGACAIIEVEQYDSIKIDRKSDDGRIWVVVEGEECGAEITVSPSSRGVRYGLGTIFSRLKVQ